jgi:hypothetical protein
MNSQPPTGDRDYLEDVLRRIERHGIEIEQRSNLVAVASRLHALRTRETDPDDIDRLDLEIDAVMRLLENGPYHHGAADSRGVAGDAQ